MIRNDHQIRYSPPVEEIMGSPPSRIVRWGTCLFGIVLVIIILASIFIRFPYTVISEVIVTTNNPPANIVARVTGRLENLSVSEGSKVTKGEILAVMESTASLENIIWVSSVIDSFVLGDVNSLQIGSVISFPENLRLGEIQNDYSDFKKSLADYLNQVAIDPIGKSIETLNTEIEGIRELVSQLVESERLYNERVIIEKRKYERELTLFDSLAISESELDNSKQSYLNEQINLQKIRSDRYLKQSDINEKIGLLVNLKAKREEEFTGLFSVVSSTKEKLRSSIDWWLQNYLLIAPIDGYVTYTKYWAENQVVTDGEIVMTVVPVKDSELVARINLTMRGSGKVKKGQDVNIRFDSYPYLQHGMVHGIVRSKALISSDNMYVVEVELPDGLRTFYDEELSFSQNMSGTAEIITDDMSLMGRLLDPFRYFTKKNKRFE